MASSRPSSTNAGVPTTATTNQSVALLSRQIKKPSSSACITKSLLYSQFGYQFTSMFAQAGYTSATIITDLAGFNPVFIGMSIEGMSMGAVIALIFAYTEANAHRTQSEHFNNAGQQKEARTPSQMESQISTEPTPNPTEPQDDDNDETPTPLTWKQSATAAGHYAGDIWQGASPWIGFAKLAGVDKIPNYGRTLTYLGAGLFSALGNAQDFVNTRKALREESKAAPGHRKS